METSDRPHVMILDDEPELLEGFSDFLNRNGIDVTFTTSPFALPFLAGTVRPDAILLDLSLSALTIDKLLSLDPYRMLRRSALVLFSGRDLHELAALTEQLGVDACLAKGDDKGYERFRSRTTAPPAAIRSMPW